MAIPQIEIVVSKDGTEVLRKILTPGEYVIGQDKTADLVLDLPEVSPKHARLTIDGGAIFIEDLGSDAGTFITGRAIKDNTRVWPAQNIRIGTAIVEAHLLKGDAVADALGEGELMPREVVAEHTYEIEKVLTREEEGATLDTHDSAIRRDLAMKVMQPGGTEQEVARFIEEAQMTGQLEHPSIPPIHELGTDEQGRPYYTMKVVRGMTLGKVLEILHDGQADAIAKYSLHPLLAIFLKACEAVAFAHSKGIIHRDLKPESINVGDHGEVLVMDWGSATVLDGSASAPAIPAAQLCASATCPQYLAPEQAQPSTLDVRTDVYALGAILYHILALRAPLNEDDPTTALKLIAAGHTDRLDLGQRYPHLPGERIPDPMAAIVTKAMSLQPGMRYQRVETLQADVLAYQNATITEAEKVGPVRQFLFVVGRYKTVSLAAAIVVGASLFFGITAVLTAIHARKQSAVDRAVVTNLRTKAPEFLRLAEFQSDTQRFDDALTSIDAAIAVDPNPPRPYWERAWALLALERWDDAANALRAAQQRGPAGADPERALAAVGKLKTMAKDPQRWKNEAAHDLFRYLESAGASGPAFSIAAKLQENAEGRRKLVDQRLLGVLGKDHYTVTTVAGGLVVLSVAGQPVRSLDALRGLPIDSVDASGTAITDAEALRLMRLQSLNLSNTKLSNVTALQGMPLRKLALDNTPVNNIAPLKGAPLEILSLEGTKVYDFTVVKSMPLRALNLKNTVMTNLNVLQGLPLDSLNLSGTFISDLSPLQGAPLKELDLRHCKKLVDLRPVLTLANLERLSCDLVPKELAALRQSKTLQTIEADAYPGEGYQGARPAATFWADFDAKAK